MPLEGHWQRVNTPLRTLTSRERRLVSAAAVLIAAATIAVVLFAASADDRAAAAGLHRRDRAGRDGRAAGRRVRRARARASAAQRLGLSDPGSLAVEADCRRAKIR